MAQQGNLSSPPQTPGEKPNSGLGVASFVISLAVAFLALLLFVILVFVELSNPGVVSGKDSPATLALGSVFVLLAFADLVALGLGIGGACQKNRKTTLAILGIIFSSIAIFGVMVLAIIGLAIDAG
jgi:hypothetical protein